MPREQPIELFMPPNMLKAKVGGGAGIDTAALKRAEAAIQNLKSEFGNWVADDVAKLIEAHGAYAKDPGPETHERLFLAAHDIKGQAATFEFLLIARVASSLCKLMDEMKAPPPASLLQAHVTAIQVIFRDKVKDNSNRVALMLIGELDARVKEALASG